MTKGRSSISKANSYEEIAEFWDTHDLSDYWDQLEPVEFEIDIQSAIIQYGIEVKLAKKISVIAKQRGISIETLINLWLQDELQIDQTKPSEYEFVELIEKKYYAIDHELSNKTRAIAKQWNVSATPLVNLWLQRKIDQLDVIPESNAKLAKRQYPVDTELSDKIRDLAKKHGISANTLVNLFLQNEIQKELREIDKTIIVGVYGTNKDII